MPSGSELLLVFGVVVLLFGGKKIPELAKGLGQGIRSFKNEMKEETLPPPAQPTTALAQTYEASKSTIEVPTKESIHES